MAAIKLNPLKIKNDFPIFKNNPGIVYLDSAATSQKPQVVIDSISEFLEKYNAPIHRAIYGLAQKSTDLYENSRLKVAKFINADAKEIVFTGNASEAINLVSYGFAKKYLKKGDLIVLSEMEHHANIVPWIMLQQQIGIKLYYLPMENDYRLDYKKIFSERIDLKKIKLVALTQASNVLGTVNPIKEIISYFKNKGIKAKFLVDGAQSIPHMKIDVKDLDCDFFVFSSHKMLGPSGVGVLWAKKEILEGMDPLFTGGQMIKIVTKESATWADVPAKFEVGTGKLEGVIGLSQAIDYLEKIGIKNIEKYEFELTKYGLKIFKDFEKYIELYGPKKPAERLSVFSFNFRQIHAHDTADILSRKQVCVRSGHHCAQILMRSIDQIATARASLYLYNTKEDLDKLAKGFNEVIKVFKLQ